MTLEKSFHVRHHVSSETMVIDVEATDERLPGSMYRSWHEEALSTYRSHYASYTSPTYGKVRTFIRQAVPSRSFRAGRVTPWHLRYLRHAVPEDGAIFEIIGFSCHDQDVEVPKRASHLAGLSRRLLELG